MEHMASVVDPQKVREEKVQSIWSKFSYLLHHDQKNTIMYLMAIISENKEWLNKSKEELRNEILQFITRNWSYAEQINMFVIVGDTMLFDEIFEVLNILKSDEFKNIFK